MSDANAMKELIADREQPPLAQLDDGLWKSWVAKGRARDRRTRDRFIKTARWATLLALFAVAAVWSSLAPYEMAARFAVTAGATILMFHTILTRNYALAAAFAAVALLFNPVIPLIRFNGDGPRLLTFACAIPFLATAFPRGMKTA